MVDRIPLYPGRVKMTPVAGQANTYDMTRADDPTQAGTPLNKATLLKDATAALYGLGESAVPDDVLAWIGAYNTYWWRRRKKPGESTWEYLHSTDRNAYPDSGEVPVSSVWVEHRENNSDTLLEYNQSYSYATEISIDQVTGEVSLVSPQTTTATNASSEMSFIKSKAPCYLKTSYDPSKIYYVPAGATFGTSYTYTLQGNGFPVQFGSSGNPHGMVVTAVQETTSYEYEYLGIPLDNAVTAPKIETGSYVGTGTYGSGNKNTLTLNFAPLLLFITKTGTGDHYVNSGYILCRNGGHSGQNGNIESAVNGNTVTWYSGISAQVQLNTSGTTYAYIAIGKES